MKRHDFFRPHIHYKITLIFVAISALILIGIYVYLNSTLKRYTLQRIRTNLIRQAFMARSFLDASPLSKAHDIQWDELADRIGKDQEIRVTVIALDGVVLGDSDLHPHEIAVVENHLYRPEVQGALHAEFGESTRFSTTLRKDMLYIASVFGGDSPGGIIRLAMPLSEIQIVSGYSKRLLIISLIVAFISSILFSVIASVYLSKPIQEMSAIAGEIAQGDFSRKVSLAANDELGDLARAFNRMSEQIRARIDEVTASKSRFEAVLLGMSEGVMVVDARCTILLMNESLRDLLAIHENAAGKKPLEVIRHIEIQEIAENVLALERGKEPREISLLFPEERILMVHSTPVVRRGNIDGAVLVFHDVTELRRLERIRQDFVANVSHELKTPVTIIKGYAETLLDGALNDTQNAREFVEIIHSDADRLARLIDDLLDLSRIESGRLDLSFQSCSITAITERVVAELNRQAGERGIAIRVDIPRNIPKIRADEAAIAQVLLNLIDNAIKYNKTKGTVTISAQEAGTHIKVEIADSGVGIPEKDLDRIFERFYRVDKARSRELGGTGLGLSIVKHLVQEHNGQVSVKSILGQGSAFSFTIPKA
ncbi:MAG: two-component system histidine kinase PnpS [bacterium]